jgi:NAD+ synthase
VPEKIVEKIPTAGLWEGQTDEGELGISYEDLDKILTLLESRTDVDEIQRKTGLDKEKIEKVKKRLKETQFKRQPVEKP